MEKLERMDCAGGTRSQRRNWRVLSKLKNGKGSPDQITADVLKALPPECLEKLARSLSVMMNFPEGLFDGSGTKSGGCYVFVQVQAGRWFVRCGEAIPPLRYESVQTAFVPKTHVDAG